MSIENIKEIMDGFDIAALFPDIQSILDLVAPAVRMLVLVGPFTLLIMGLYYFLAGPKEATYSIGYRCRWGMGSVEAWRFTQKFAGILFILMGLGLAIALAVWGKGLQDLPLMDMLLTAAIYIAIQAAVAGLGCLVINLVVLSRYDYQGNRRLTWAELWRG